MSIPDISFEFFPPKTEAMADTLWQSVQKLAPLRPRFVSVTYGAGGSTRDRTHRTVARIIEETGLNVAAHLTTIDATQAEVDAVLRDYWAAGVRHIVALRGDPAAGVGAAYVPVPEGYANAAALAGAARRIAPFEITVGCYPEKHPESASMAADIDMLRQKVDAGATRAITQFFFDNDVFERYRDAVAAAGINVAIVPGIMPIGNFAALTRMARLCGTSIPQRLVQLFENLDEDPDTRRLIAATVAAEQCADLVTRGVSAIHFYTLNRSELTYALCHMLGIRPTPAIAAA